MAFTITLCGGNGIGRIEEICINRRDGKYPIIQPGRVRTLPPTAETSISSGTPTPVPRKPRRDHGMAPEALLPMLTTILP